mmetsp:Transcript_12215/g.18476  ORF Transcript_12215/g.18476 Transcript_12215/m.18476 type:complete len:202 (-) Transcript_12215:2573-3178(-)
MLSVISGVRSTFRYRVLEARSRRHTSPILSSSANREDERLLTAIKPSRSTVWPAEDEYDFATDDASCSFPWLSSYPLRSSLASSTSRSSATCLHQPRIVSFNNTRTPSLCFLDSSSTLLDTVYLPLSFDGDAFAIKSSLPSISSMSLGNLLLKFELPLINTLHIQLSSTSDSQQHLPRFESWAHNGQFHLLSTHPPQCIEH